MDQSYGQLQEEDLLCLLADKVTAVAVVIKAVVAAAADMPYTRDWSNNCLRF